MALLYFLDECFLPFVTDNSTQSLLPECAAYSNLFLLRALQNNMPWQDFVLVLAYVPTKFYYNKCSIAVSLECIHTCTACGDAALQCNDYWAQSLTLIDTERAFLIQELKKRNMNIIPSKANYILFYSSIPLEQKLKEYNILIRNCENYRGLTKGYYPHCCTHHEENIMLLHAMDRILQEV